MEKLSNLEKKDWFKRLPITQRQLVEQSFYLLSEIGYKEIEFYDYSFIVMPASKAYEGFVKDFLFRNKLISEKRYKGNKFRVGKALNPALAEANPDGFENLYDDISELFKSEELANQMWETWKECRNQVFHYFHEQEKAINLYQAKGKLQKIIDTMELVYEFDVIVKAGYRFGI